MHSDPDIAVVLEQLVRVVRRMATAGDLGLPAAAVLARLDRAGPQRLTDLAAAEGISQPGTTQLVTRLERDGLVRRTPSPDDGRVVLVAVTDDGRALVERRRDERSQTLTALLDRLDPAERDAVERALPALAHLADLALDRTRGVPA
ncbi:MAG: MarR family transcriptional regulator [Mycobacterium sp.]|nr:MarR family transcriptional regulator [Mycobacterium sp.]